MNIVLNYDPVAAADPSFVADAQAAVAILNRTFTNNITLTFDIGLGSILSWDRLTQSFVRGPSPQTPLQRISTSSKPLA